ncbi:MAG: hypothetical protein ACLP8Y_01865 [Thermoplasmata archaeon]
MRVREAQFGPGVASAVLCLLLLTPMFVGGSIHGSPARVHGGESDHYTEIARMSENGGGVAGRGHSASVHAQTGVHPVTFLESGLPSGNYGATAWSITIALQTLSSNTTAIRFELTDGNYSYHVNIVPGYEPASANGNLTVSGTAVNISVAFSIVRYTIAFGETGLTLHTDWCVNLTPGSLRCSIAKTITFIETNGTYSYSCDATGYSGSAGLIMVNGTNPSPVLIAFASNPPNSSGVLEVEYAVIGGVLVVGATALLVVLWRRRRRPTPTAPNKVPDPDADASPEVR